MDEILKNYMPRMLTGDELDAASFSHPKKRLPGLKIWLCIYTQGIDLFMKKCYIY